MINFISKNKNKFMLLSSLLIITALSFQYFGFDITRNILLIIATVLSGVPIFIKAVQATLMKQFSIELLVVLAVTGALFIQEYIEASVVTFLFLLGNYLETRTLNKMRSALKKLITMSPKNAEVIRNGEIVTLPINEVKLNDIIIAKAGTIVAVDGIISRGSATINEASVTGESMPVDKSIDDSVFSGTLIEDGYIEIIATKVGRDTTFNKMIQLIEEAQETKSKTQKFLDKFAQVYTPAIVVLAIIVFAITTNLHLAIVFLVVACPGALVIGAPVSIVAGIANGARNGVLTKGAEAIDAFAKVDALVLDKTGTLTIGKPSVVNAISYLEDSNWLYFASSAEQISEHHLGKAIIEYAKNQNLTLSEDIQHAKIIKGGGISAVVEGKHVFVGTEKLLEDEKTEINQNIKNDILKAEQSGHTTVVVAIDKEVHAIVAIADEIKPEAKEAIAKLKKLKIKKIIMLTGDNEAVAKNVGKLVGVDEVYAKLKPEDKVGKIKQLQSLGYKVAMIGDGLNDAPALASANVGVAMGVVGVEISTEVADVVLMSDNLTQLTHALELARATHRNMKQNTFIAVATVAVLLSGVLFEVVNLASGMFVHEGSILVVILNAMRLLTFKSK